MSSNRAILFLRKVNEEMKWFEEGEGKVGDGKYSGEIENGMPNGQGTLTESNGEKYEGEWKDGLMHGKGTYNWLYGKKSVGEWKDGEKWNITSYDRYGNILSNWVNGEQMKKLSQKKHSQIGFYNITEKTNPP